ncbi:ABC transporter ATP-binding protein [Sporosarcina ureilytica]|uniref:ABC transporter ATP-binding protein n=1 Tax=Sporosarcina ureilytica TaxID=298596 RepID=UPI000B18DF16|nr:ABC transporter ATP-binding protein [Sporosarcina ureilytica]
MNLIVSMQDVSLLRNHNQILSNIQWEIKEGEHWGILGLNGSGKTSLLNIINGYHFPTTGEVSVLGNHFGKTNLPELRKEIGFVSSSLDRFSDIVNQETVLRVVISGKFASFGIYENIEAEDWEKADALLESLRLSYLRNQPFHLLSQGEQRRVLIARALMSDPKMLILDEPCSGLDILSREELLTMLHQIADRGCHILYVTHHIEELVEEITHALLIKDGKIFAAGPKKEVITDELLSNIFKVPVEVHWKSDRPSLSITNLKIKQSCIP